jgi:ribosomal protein L32
MASPAYFVWGPATFVVLLVVGLLLVLGTLLLRRRNHDQEEPGGDNTCGKCGHYNVANAKFCARCGHDLQEAES